MVYYKKCSKEEIGNKVENNEIAIIFKKVLLFKEISRRGGACLHPSPSGGDELRPYAGLNLLPKL